MNKYIYCIFVFLLASMLAVGCISDTSGSGIKDVKTITDTSNAENNSSGIKDVKTTTDTSNAENNSSGIKDVKTTTDTSSAENNSSGIKDVRTTTDTSNVENNLPQEQTTPQAKGSFENPAGIGETVALSSTGNNYEVSVVNVTRGTQADYLVNSTNELNEKAPPGYEYILVKMRVAYTQGNDNINIGEYNFKALCEGVECKNSFAVLPNSYITWTAGDIMPGATKEGWLQYTVPQNKEVIISFQTNMFYYSTAYFSIGK